jgi:hypothetical protein
MPARATLSHQATTWPHPHPPLRPYDGTIRILPSHLLLVRRPSLFPSSSCCTDGLLLPTVFSLL